MPETPPAPDRIAAIRARCEAAAGRYSSLSLAPLVAVVREDVPYLLDRVERLEAALTWIEDWCAPNMHLAHIARLHQTVTASLAPDAPHREPHAQETA